MKFIVAFLALLSLSVILIAIGLSGPQAQPSSVAAVNIAVQRESARTGLQVLCIKAVGILIITATGSVVILLVGWTLLTMRRMLNGEPITPKWLGEFTQEWKKAVEKAKQEEARRDNYAQW